NRVIDGEGRITMHPVKPAAGALRIVEDSEPAPDDSVGGQLIRETKPRRKELVLGLNTQMLVGIESGNQHFACAVVEIHKTIRHLNRWREKLIPQAEIKRQALVHLPVVSDVAADFEHTDTSPKQLEVLTQGSIRTQQETGDSVARARGAVWIRCKGRVEGEQSVALVHLVVDDLAADQAGAELERVGSKDLRKICYRVEGVFQANRRNRCWTADAGVSIHIENRHAVGFGQLIRVGHAEQCAESRSACRSLRVQVVHVEARESHAKIAQQ